MKHPKVSILKLWPCVDLSASESDIRASLAQEFSGNGGCSLTGCLSQVMISDQSDSMVGFLDAGVTYLRLDLCNFNSCRGESSGPK